MVTVNNDMSIDSNGNVSKALEYKGLSTDTKPVNCAVNSMFLELDTGDFYYFTGESWAKVGG